MVRDNVSCNKDMPPANNYMQIEAIYLTFTMMLPCQLDNQMCSQYECAHQFYLLIPAIAPGTFDTMNNTKRIILPVWKDTDI